MHSLTHRRFFRDNDVMFKWAMSGLFTIRSMGMPHNIFSLLGTVMIQMLHVADPLEASYTNATYYMQHQICDMWHATSDTTVHTLQLHHSCPYTNKICVLLFLVGYCLSFFNGKSAFFMQ